MYPIDTIKTRLQMTQSTAFRLTGLYKGVVGSLVGQVPYGVLTFGSYEIYKQILHERFPTIASTQPAIIYVASAILGDITGSGWLCPSEVIKQQLQAGIYTNTLDAIRGICSTGGGGLKGFYKGYTGGLARDVPFRVAQLTTFEITKRFYLRTKQQQQRQQCAGSSSSSSSGKSSTTEESESLSALEAAACGAIAGSFSAAITNPLDRIKTLMMTDVTNVYGGSVFTCAQKMVRNDGLIGGLFTGVIPRVVYIAPSVCIFFVTYELVQQKLITPKKKVSSS
jgi:solute carrier family 25 S-adenosylmethionine transporter 26